MKYRIDSNAMLDTCANLPLIGDVFDVQNIMVYAAEKDYVGVAKTIPALSLGKALSKTKLGKKVVSKVTKELKK